MGRAAPDPSLFQLRGYFASRLVRSAPLSGKYLIEGFFSKLARSALRHIRVESKQELKDRIMAAMDELHPVVHTWSYKLDQAAWDMIRTSKSMY